MKRFFNASCLVGLLSFILLNVAGVQMFILKNNNSSFYNLVGNIGSILCFIFFSAYLMLWIEGWLFLIKGWENRSTWENIALIAFLIIGSIIAAYVLHYINNRRRTNE